MSKITKKDLNERLLMVETLLGLHRALPEQISNDQANNAIFRMQCALSSGKELAERKPQLKQLDQSVFDGLDEKWRFAAVNAAGRLMYSKTRMVHDKKYWWASSKSSDLSSGTDGYDTSNWQNSLIERDTTKELTGSELCKAMLERGDKYVMCGVSDVDDNDAENHEDDDFLAEAVTDFDDKDGLFGTTSMRWNYAVPINNMGEPLTAKEVGL